MKLGTSYAMSSLAFTLICIIMDLDSAIKHIFFEESLSTEKVCIPLQLENGEYIISNDLNGACYYCIVDFKEKESSFLDLKEIQQIFISSNGKGFQSLSITTIICDGVAPMALKILSDAGISVKKPKNSDIIENLQLILKNQLDDFTGKDESSSASCSTSSCNSCSSTSCN